MAVMAWRTERSKRAEWFNTTKELEFLRKETREVRDINAGLEKRVAELETIFASAQDSLRGARGQLRQCQERCRCGACWGDEMPAEAASEALVPSAAIPTAAELAHGIADGVAGLARCELHAQCSKLNQARMREYSHKGFVAQAQECGMDGLMSLIDNVVSSCLESGKTFFVSEVIGSKLDRLKATVAALICSTVCGDFKWTFGWIASLHLRALTGSEMAVDALNGMLLGASPKTRTFRRQVDKAVASLPPPSLSGSGTVRMCGDQVGKYVVKQARADREYKERNAAAPVVVFLMVAFYCANEKLEDAATGDIQRMHCMSPLAYVPWRNFMETCSSILEPSSVEVKRIEAQIVGYVGVLMKDCVDMLRRKELRPVRPTPTEAFESEDDDVNTDQLVKKCRICDTENEMRKNKCVVCGNKLPKKSEILRDMKPVTLTQFRERRRPQQQPAVPGRDGDGDGDRDVSRKRKHTLIEVKDVVETATVAATAEQTLAELLAKASADELQFNEISGDKIFADMIGTFPCNPTSDKARELCAAEMARIARVRDFVTDEEEIEREWVWMICDAGAMTKKNVYATTGKHARIAWCLGAGHVDQCLLTVVWRLAWGLFGGVIAAAAMSLGFSPASIDKVRLTGDNWKRRDVLAVARKAVIRKAIRDEMGKDEQATVTDVEMLERLRTREADGDQTASIVVFFADIVGAYFAQLAAQRRNRYDFFIAAIKNLLPLLYARGHHQYGPLIVWEYITYVHRAPKRVGLDFVEFWCHQPHTWGGGEVRNCSMSC